MDRKNQKEFKNVGLKKKIVVGSKIEKTKEKEIEEILPQELKSVYKEIHPEVEKFEKVISINRTAKVTKGGKRLSFGALVVAGDKKGNVGYGFGKSNEVPNAIKKSINDAKKNMINVPLKGTTIPHEVMGKYGAAVVFFKPAGEGTGVIAGNTIRAVCEAAGIKDILTKCLKSQTPTNVLKATFDAFKKLRYKNELLESEQADTEVEEAK